ncbi:DUF2130 domain-containing protein [Azoarcus sp. KH32C]|uniref:DUF2130 domain-containing protein n=1 Tax=Azoarcus sp. KH32C TaxID=748247 RepID=UPI00023865DC|nr:DUF2130 domain-containing protein [Azoarcus sp. KH32C]BAL23662.1 hypothetical protein AZKH_1340 [Azoarcus sp. KH32C]
MVHKIILAADEPVCCPHCAQSFPLSQGITRQTIEHYEQELEAVLKVRESELRDELAQDAERRLSRKFNTQLESLKDELTERDRKLAESKSRLDVLIQEARTKAIEEVAEHQKTLLADLEQKEAKLREFRAQELQLRKEKKALEDARQEMELQLQRRLDEARGELEHAIRGAEAERFRLVEAEYKKKIEDAQKANEDLHRKLQQGSAQLQGEVLELELEEVLRAAFPLDDIQPVAKGKRGADVVQQVRTPMGQVCGTVIWESKRAANWSEAWVAKLKDDQQEARADVAVLVATTMPKDIHEPFAMHNGIWVVRPDAMRPLGETLRVLLVELQKARASNEGRQEKMALLYDYLSSPQFVQKVRTVVEAFVAMKKDLDAEKSAMQRIWKKRETQIERVSVSMMGMCGELQAIAQNALPQLDDIARLPEGATDVELAEL